ncbi:MAG TPA: glycosyltransferase family A protein, partial [Dehalococcoidia bacterium]|nr:glycosyltransferase family A protein [Dehalococcoidia bacterium]
MNLAWAILIAAGIFSVLAVFRNLALLRYRLVPPPADKSGPGDLVSVIIPARNEESNIRGCLESVLAQTYRPLEIIVVDDNSTDGTGRILAEMAELHPELSVVQGEPLPPGWVGKNHALTQGVARAHGQWLAFLDADTRMGPEAVG